LLAGSPPFSGAELKKKGLLEILRVVREEEPPRPSTKLSTADALPSLSANRGTEPKKLTGLLRNELDWIVMKALEKDRTRRYETANGFAADVQRYLGGEAVFAHPPSTTYRLRKFVRRNKGQVIAAGLVLLALVAGVIGTTLGLIEARRQERLTAAALVAETERAEGERQAKLAADRQRALAEANIDSLHDAVRRFSGLLDREPRLQQLDLFEVRTDLYKLSADFYDIVVNQKSSDPAALVEAANLGMFLAYALRFNGRNADALAAVRKSSSRYATAVKLRDDPAYVSALSNTRAEGSALMGLLGQREESIIAMTEAANMLEPLLTHPDPAWRTHGTVYRAFYWQALATFYIGGKSYALAEPLHRRATATLPASDAVPPALYIVWHITAARNWYNEGTLACQNHRPDDGIRAYTSMTDLYERLLQAYPTEAYRSELAMGQFAAGSSLAAAGRGDQAAEYFRKAEARYADLAKQFPSVASHRAGLAVVRKLLEPQANIPPSAAKAKYPPELAPPPKAVK